MESPAAGQEKTRVLQRLSVFFKRISHCVVTNTFTGLLLTQDKLTTVCRDVSSQNEPVLSPLLDDLTDRCLALSPYEALLLALHQLLQVAPHLHLLYVGAVALPHHLLLLTQLLEPQKEESMRKKNMPIKVQNSALLF